MLQRWRIRRSMASGVVGMLVRNKWRVVRVPLRVVVVVSTSTIQALPGQLASMGSGASMADRSQDVWCPCRFS